MTHPLMNKVVKYKEPVFITLKASISPLSILQELGLLLVLVAVAILTYSSLVYFAEKEIPDGNVRRIRTGMTIYVMIRIGLHKLDCKCL